MKFLFKKFKLHRKLFFYRVLTVGHDHYVLDVLAVSGHDELVGKKWTVGANEFLYFTKITFDIQKS